MNMKKLYTYLLRSEDYNVVTMEEDVIKETLFSYVTRTRTYRKREIGKVIKVVKGSLTDCYYLSLEKLDDPFSVFGN